MKRLFVLALFCLALHAQNTPGFVQSRGSGLDITGNTGLAYTSNVTAGNALYAYIWDGSGAGNTEAFTDSQGNMWSVVKTQSLATDGDTTAMACAIAGSSAADTVHFTLAGSGTVASGNLTIWEVSNSTCTTNGSNSANTTGTTCSSGSITTTVANDFLLGGCGTASGNAGFTVGGGWSHLTTTTSGNFAASQMQVGTSTGMYTSTMTMTNLEYASMIVAFKATVPASIGIGNKVKKLQKLGVLD